MDPGQRRENVALPALEGAAAETAEQVVEPGNCDSLVGLRGLEPEPRLALRLLAWRRGMLRHGAPMERDLRGRVVWRLVGKVPWVVQKVRSQMVR